MRPRLPSLPALPPAPPPPPLAEEPTPLAPAPMVARRPGSSGKLGGLDWIDDAETMVGVDVPPSAGGTLPMLSPDFASASWNAATESERVRSGVAAFAPEDDQTLRPNSGPMLGPHQRRPPASAMTPVMGAKRYIGMTLCQRYRLLRVLGEGGMGAIFEAEHIEIGKRVAIKLLTGMPDQHEEAAARFQREARSLSRVESQHVVQVFDVGEEPGVGLFMVMELLRGQDVGQVLKSRGRLPPKIAAAVIVQACLALEKAHEVGIVHRDLKPANVFLTAADDGSYRVKIVDFGIAKLIEETQNVVSAITRHGAAVGTPQYMSPEQARGHSVIDHRTDIYSLGAVFFEALVGQPAVPRLRSYEATIVHIVSNFAPRVLEHAPDVPAPLDQLVTAMMRASSDDRLPSARAVRDRLVEIYPDLETFRIQLDGGFEAVPELRDEPVGVGGTLDGSGNTSARSPVRLGPTAQAAIVGIATAVIVSVIAFVFFVKPSLDEAERREQPASSAPRAIAALDAAKALPRPSTTVPSSPVVAGSVLELDETVDASAPLVLRSQGRIALTSSGRSCEAAVDGAIRGWTPLENLETSPGIHAVTCRFSGDAGGSAAATLMVQAGQVTRHQFRAP